MSSALAHHSGHAAEETAARGYLADGGRVRASRWRCPEGELDLVVEFPGEIVFVEVKARRAHDAAAVSARQWARIGAAATRYLAEETDGAPPLPLRPRAGRPLRPASSGSRTPAASTAGRAVGAERYRAQRLWITHALRNYVIKSIY